MRVRIERRYDKIYNVYYPHKDKLFYMFTIFEEDLRDLVGEVAYNKIQTCTTDGAFATLRLTAEVV